MYMTGIVEKAVKFLENTFYKYGTMDTATLCHLKFTPASVHTHRGSFGVGGRGAFTPPPPPPPENLGYQFVRLTSPP